MKITHCVFIYCVTHDKSTLPLCFPLWFVERLKSSDISSCLVFKEHSSMMACFCDLVSVAVNCEVLSQPGEKWLTCLSTSAQGKGSVPTLFFPYHFHFVNHLVDLISIQFVSCDTVHLIISNLL